MKPIFKFFVFLFLVSATLPLSNCVYKNAMDIYPTDTSGCKTANMSYKNDIEPIIRENHCYTCHGIDSNATGNGIILEGYSNLLKNGVPNDFIYRDITAPDGTINHMPGGYPDVDPCEILKIKAWLDQGYKNN